MPTVGNLSVSGSLEVTGSLVLSSSFTFNSNITASGNISASGEGRFQTLGVNYSGALSTGSASSQNALRVEGNTRINGGSLLVINSASTNEYLYYKNENKSLYLSITSSNTPVDPQLSLVQDGKVKAGFGWDDEGDQQDTFIANYTLFTASLSLSSSLGGISLATSASDGTVERLKISQRGNVGIGTSTPGKKLEVSGSISASGNIQGNEITGSSLSVGSLTSAVNPAIHAKTSNTSENILLESTDTGAGSAPDLVLFRNAGAPSDNDTLGVIEYKANQIGGSNPFVYNGIYSRVIDASQQQSALTISAFYGSSTSHAIGIHNLADNTTSGAVIVNPTGFAQVPQHTLQVEGTTSISSSLFVSGSVVIFKNLPTSNPNVAGQLYNDGGTLKISAG